MKTKTLIPAILLALLACSTAGTALAEIILTTDQPEYSVGEIVHISAYNAGPDVEQFLSAPFFAIVNDDTNDCIFGCIGLPVITPFAVGETVSMDWDTGAIPDVPGHHTVTVAVTDGPTVGYILTDAVPVETHTWGTLKAVYR